MGSEKFCLRWNDFENNISSAFRELRDDKDFFDVTLACDDEQIQAHKVILSACSPFFRNVLRRNPHQHPLLYLKGVKYTDLQSVLNFMYHGEVNVAQEELNSFLAVAEDLRVKGLTQNQSGSQSANKKENNSSRPKSPNISKPIPPRQDRDQALAPPKPRPRPLPPVHHSAPPPEEDDIQEVMPIKSEPREPPVHNVYHPPEPVQQAPLEDHSLTTYQEEEAGYEDYGMEQYEAVDQQYDVNQPIQGVDQGKGTAREQLAEYITKIQDETGSKYSCTLCHMSNNLKSNVMNHVESAHFPDSFAYNCDYCEKTFKSLNSKNVHVSRNHKDIHVKKYMYK